MIPALGVDSVPAERAESTREPREEEDEDSDNTDEYMTLEEVMDGTEELIDELIRIGAAIRRAGKKSRLRKADWSFDPKDYQGFRHYMIQILLGLPSAIEASREASTDGEWSKAKLDFTRDSLNAVQDRLINANLRRRHRFTQARRHGEKLASYRLDIQADKIARVAAKSEVPEPIGKTGHRGTGLIEPARKKSDEVQDQAPRHFGNGAEMSVDTKYSEHSKIILPQTALSERTTSRALSSTATRLDYPTRPRLALDHGVQSFKCPCCWQSLRSTLSNNQWK